MILTVDFETLPIRPRPDYPPAPVGVAVKLGSRPGKYLAWGHPSGNNCTRAQGLTYLRNAWRDAEALLFHHAGFDLAVATEKLGFPWPTVPIHDTLPLLFLLDPYAPSYGLKPSAERLLGLPPEELDAVADWLVEAQPVPGRRLTRTGAREFVALAPGSVVGPYAVGDVDRTRALFDLIYPKARKLGLLTAYDREVRLLPVLSRMERGGVPVSLPRLRRAAREARRDLDAADAFLRRRLRAPDLNVNAGADVADLLLRRGLADAEVLGVTPKSGKPRSDGDSISAAVRDRRLANLLAYRGKLATSSRTFFEPWLEVAERTGGTVYCEWRSTRGVEKGGARTGRLSSTPNFQNVPKEPDMSRLRPSYPFVRDLPDVRAIIAPPRGDVLLDRDYSQQELRILAHFEDGDLRARYLAEPWTDFHEAARKMVNEALGTDYSRKPIKNMGFGLLYGMGLGKLAVSVGTDVAGARTLRDGYLGALPGLDELNDDLKALGREGKAIRTWGGRLYHVEPPRMVEGRLRTFEYKLLNNLVQGSAADATKEAMIRVDAAVEDLARLLLTVHDELLLLAPRESAREAMSRAREAMESVEFDVPMLSEGTWSEKSWSSRELRPYDERGVLARRLP